MTNDQTSAILERIDSLQKSLNRIDSDLAEDRKTMQNNDIRLGALEGVIEQLKTDIAKMSKRVREGVEDAVQPITDTLAQVKKEGWWKKYVKKNG